MRETQMSDEDRQNVNKLRELVKENLTEYYDTDFNLLRWLQGHHPQPIEQIAEKLNRHLKARSSKWELDKLGTAPREHVVHKHWKYGITGMSKVLDNVVVNIEQCGQTDYYGLVHSHSLTEVLRARIFDLENMHHCVMEVEKKTGKQAWILYVMDLTDLKIDKHLYYLMLGPLRGIAEFMTNHYVELIKNFVLVNVPKLVYALWYTAQPILPEKTKEKVKILSASNWRNEILQFAAAESLPDKWNVGEQNLFTATVSLPVKVDENDYYGKHIEIPNDAEKIVLYASKTHFLTRELNAGDVLSWWIIANGDLGFGIYRADDKNEDDIDKMEVVYPNMGFLPGPLLVPLEGNITADKHGYYKTYFSNARAWWQTLIVNCRLTVTNRMKQNACTKS